MESTEAMSIRSLRKRCMYKLHSISMLRIGWLFVVRVNLLAKIGDVCCLCKGFVLSEFVPNGLAKLCFNAHGHLLHQNFFVVLLKCGSEFARHVERQVGDAVGNGKVGGVQHVGG